MSHDDFKLDMNHLQKVQRTLPKAGNIFPNEHELITHLEEKISKAQDDMSFNTFQHPKRESPRHLKTSTGPSTTTMAGIRITKGEIR